MKAVVEVELKCYDLSHSIEPWEMRKKRISLEKDLINVLVCFNVLPLVYQHSISPNL